MTLLDRITKLLRKHNARLIIETRNDQPEIVLSVPAWTTPDGQTVFAYATDYRLGQAFPQYTETTAPDAA
ncbi:MAG: hypothetical protein KDJ28_01405 [Candidatus Competibacteraceae bacterium]|nr:hypothetical protein [Candidatus Competibacteraceae bacterium]